MSDYVRHMVVGAWLVATGLGVSLSFMVMWLSRQDISFLHEHQLNGIVEGQSKLSFWNSFRRFIIMLFLFLAGISSLAAPVAPAVCRQAASRFSWGFIFFLFSVVGLLDYSSFSELVFRKRFIKQGRI